MLLRDKVVVVTGGASGIGAALARRFAVEGASVVVADLDGEGATSVADEIEGLAVTVDVADESELVQLVDRTEEAFGPIDLFCANAGMTFEGGVEVLDAGWERMWRVNFLSHVYAARHLVPRMVSRGEGYLLHTASAAGLLTSLGAASYAVTKHAVVALAEWLAITYGDAGLRVSCLCPQGVRTNMQFGPLASLLAATAIDPEEVAEAVVGGLEAEAFLILPHPEVAGYFQYKASDYDAWLAGMRRLQRSLFGA